MLKLVGIGVPVLVILAIVGVVGFLYYKMRYKTARSNQALIISGAKLGDPEKTPNIFTDTEGRALKIIRGGGHLLHINQTATPVDLTSFQLRMTTPRIYTNGGVPIVADAVATVAVSGTLKGIAIYAEQFLGKKQSEIENDLTEVLGANLRAILSKLTVEDINVNRESFNEQVREVAQKQLDGMGFQITSLGLTDLRDADPDNGYLDNLGRPLIAEARKNAELAEANSDKETRIYKANADKEAQEQEIKRQAEIADSNKEKDLKLAAIKEETERARAKSEQSYQLEKTILSKKIQEEEIKVNAQKKEEELRIQKLERTRQVEIEEEVSKIRAAKADAEYYEKTKEAEAEAKKAEIDGLAQAKIERERGLAEAEVILKKGTAEAESRRLLAKAIAEHGEVVITEKLIEMLPLYAEKIAQPLANIDSVKIIDTGSGDGMASYAKGITNTLTGLQEPLKELVGLDVSKLLTDVVNRGNTHTTVVAKDTENLPGTHLNRHALEDVLATPETDVDEEGHTQNEEEEDETLLFP